MSNHPDLNSLLNEMHADTVKRLCKDVPVFGKILGKVSDEMVEKLRMLYADIDKCIVKKTTTTTAKL